MGGGLMQLTFRGAPDVYLDGDFSEPHFYNSRDSLCYYFINNKDGFPIKSDLPTVSKQPLILDHVPEYYKPDGLNPFKAKKERAASKIQKAWKNAICNPEYSLCKNRLLKEFSSLL